MHLVLGDSKIITRRLIVWKYDDYDIIHNSIYVKWNDLYACIIEKFQENFFDLFITINSKETSLCFILVLLYL